MHLTWFTVIKFLHVASVVLGMGTAIFLHAHFLFGRIKWGTFRHVFSFGSRMIWFGLTGAIVTGIIFWIMLPSPRPAAFYIKLSLVALLVFDGIVIHYVGKPRLNLLKPDQGFFEVDKRLRPLLFISGGISVMGWWGSLMIAYLL